MRFLSWNLAMLERSAQAPHSFQDFHIDDAVRHAVLAVEPDVVCYQELPRVPFVESLALLQATTMTHSGNLAMLVTHEINGTEDEAAEPPPIKIVERTALLTTFAETDALPAFTIANVHLTPGPGAADLRLQQFRQVMAASPTDELFIVGDTNTRLDEAEVLAEAGFVGDKPPQPTWNSRRNRFRTSGPEFSAYFTRWFSTPGLGVRDPVVHDMPVEFQEHRFHLSDHFALSGEIVAT